MEIMIGPEMELLFGQKKCINCEAEGSHNFHIIKGDRVSSKPGYVKCLICGSAYKIAPRMVHRITPKISRDPNVIWRPVDSEQFLCIRGYKISIETFKKKFKQYCSEQSDNILSDIG
jgi:hypothetical protein